jgi:hypothetical protein
MAWGTANAQPMTISFWARASVAGTYRLLIQNFDGSITTAWFPFTLAGGSSFQWVTVTIPAQTTGIWKTDYNIGAQILIEIASSGTPNLVVAGSYFSITGVVVLPGLEGPSAARSAFIMRPYDQELGVCRRYFRFADGSALRGGQSGNATSVNIQGETSPQMRVGPTAVLLKTSWVAGSYELLVGGAWISGAVVSLTGYGASPTSFFGALTGFSGMPTGAPVYFNFGGNILSLDARL